MANNLAVLQKDLTDQINTKLDDLRQQGLATPKNYNPANALKSAFYAMTNAQGGNLLMKGTKESIANSLIDMVVQGLTPAKDQVYFIPYGNKVTLQRSYFGTQAALKRLNNVKDIWAEVVHQGDEFEIGAKAGRLIVSKFKPSFENLDKPIVGVYAVIEKSDGEQVYTVMTKKQIDTSWSQAHTSAVQKKFPGEMAKRTVINRAAKNFLNTSDDSDLLVDAINRTTSNEYDGDVRRKDVTPEESGKKTIADFVPTKKPAASDQPKDNHPESKDDVIDIKDEDPVDGFLKKHEQKGDAKHDDSNQKPKTDSKADQASLFDSLKAAESAEAAKNEAPSNAD